MDYIYSLEKFNEAVYLLATLPGTIKQRLAEAGDGACRPQLRDVPPHLHKQFETICWQLTQNGTIAETVASMSEMEAAEIAKLICLLSDELRQADTSRTKKAG